jgi:heparan-alpha-glucosaminide N-acetyltransferase
MDTRTRISSIDIMRGLTLFLMLFVNDLNMHIAPSWLGHMKADFDGMGLADWVFPGFLFIAGMSVPFSLSKRISSGQDLAQISKHIITRTISLLIIGVLMLNTERVDPELTGLSQNLWALLMYLGVFLIWNDYQNKETKFFRIAGLRLAGMALLCFLVMKFKSGQPENNGSLVTEWWGILGLIGWGYLVSAFTYILCRDSILKTAAVAVCFLALNMLSGWHLIKVPGILSTVLGVIIDGNVPFIVLSGLIAGLIIKKLQLFEFRKVLLVFAGLGIFFLISGFVLRKWFIISKIIGTPSWAMICCGISLFVFIIIYWLADVRKLTAWAAFVRPAGENSLTTYLAPDIIYYLIWSSGIPFLIYKESSNPLIVILGSLLWSLLMVWMTALLVRLKIKLKL